ncbi:BLUF domain-containing protein [Methylobacterium sp. WSM2598]|uniref:BLUF domain-containing protein n=1 Tax=Methylobacterium sp. WSM2598 TaxID=398261 RepID=UPI0012F6A579|nr:BLUF domain-containing protein [Methylobacterium sp. WSM2598]
MRDARKMGQSLPLIAHLAEELAFALAGELVAENYKRPSTALRRLADAKALLDHYGYPAGPMLAETVEIAITQGSVLPHGPEARVTKTTSGVSPYNFEERFKTQVWTSEICVLYVSRRLATGTDIHDIVEKSLSRNPNVGITGALVSSKYHFAQYLEGHPSAVRQLMDNIEHDSRHADVTIFLVASLPKRRFGSWSLAYSGASKYVDQHMKSLIEAASPATEEQQIMLLLALMEKSIK